MIGEVFSVKKGGEVDPLLDAMGVLEANCVLDRDILSCMCNVCSRLFGIFFLKKKKEMPEHVGKLVKTIV
jgi:hypothetical protein